MDANEQTPADAGKDTRSAEERFQAIVRMLTNPEPPLSVEQMTMLAEHHILCGTAAFNQMTEQIMAQEGDGPMDQGLLTVGVALSSMDISIGRAFADLARLKAGQSQDAPWGWKPPAATPYLEQAMRERDRPRREAQQIGLQSAQRYQENTRLIEERRDLAEQLRKVTEERDAALARLDAAMTTKELQEPIQNGDAPWHP